MVTWSVSPNISKVPTAFLCRTHRIDCGWGIQTQRRMPLPSKCRDLRRRQHAWPVFPHLRICKTCNSRYFFFFLGTCSSSTQCTPSRAVKFCCIYCPPFVPLTKVCAFTVLLLLCHGDFTMTMSCVCTRCTLWIVCRLIYSPLVP